MVVVLQYTWQASSLARGGSITTVHLEGILSSQEWQYYYSTPGRHPLYPGVVVVLQYTWKASSLAMGGSSTTVHLADILSSQGWQYYYSTPGRHPL